MSQWLFFGASLTQKSISPKKLKKLKKWNYPIRLHLLHCSKIGCDQVFYQFTIQDSMRSQYGDAPVALKKKPVGASTLATSNLNSQVSSWFCRTNDPLISGAVILRCLTWSYPKNASRDSRGGFKAWGLTWVSQIGLIMCSDGRTVMSLVCHVTSLSHVFQFWSVTVTSLSRFFRDKDVTITSLSQFFRDEGVIVTGLSRISKFRVVTVTSMSRFFRAKRVTSTSLSLSLYCHWFVMGYA